jgi:hypothetical protein
MTDTAAAAGQVQVGGDQARQVAGAAREKEWSRPSFAKELFLGHLRLDLVHPDPRPSLAQAAKGEEFLGRFEASLRDEVDPLEIEREARIPEGS